MHTLYPQHSEDFQQNSNKYRRSKPFRCVVDAQGSTMSIGGGVRAYASDLELLDTNFTACSFIPKGVEL